MAGVSRNAPEILYYAPFLVPVAWVGVGLLVSYVSGWQSLASAYRAERPFDGKRWSMQSARLRWGMGYNNCLTVGGDSWGLYLAMPLPFRVGHAPLLVPWHELEVGVTNSWLGSSCRMEFRQVPGVSVTIPARLAERLKEVAGPAWPGGDRAKPLRW